MRWFHRSRRAKLSTIDGVLLVSPAALHVRKSFVTETVRTHGSYECFTRRHRSVEIVSPFLKRITEANVISSL